MKKLKNLTWKDAVLPLPAVLVILLWSLLAGCNKEHVTPKPSLYSSVLGDWKYENDSIKVYFTLTDSIGNRWATHGVVTYKGLTQYQLLSEEQTANNGDNYNIVCSNLNAIVTSPTASNDYSTIQALQLILYHGFPNPTILNNVKFKRK